MLNQHSINLSCPLGEDVYVGFKYIYGSPVMYDSPKNCPIGNKVLAKLVNNDNSKILNKNEITVC